MNPKPPEKSDKFAAIREKLRTLCHNLSTDEALEMHLEEVEKYIESLYNKCFRQLEQICQGLEEEEGQSMSLEKYFCGLRMRIAQESASGSFDEAVKAIELAKGRFQCLI